MDYNQLNQLWEEYSKDQESRMHLRFGQYIYNKINWEFKNSYQAASYRSVFDLLQEELGAKA